MMDLHTHSTHSDGSYTPTELVALAKHEGVTHMALTDHDSVDGAAEAMEAALREGVKLIAGIEIDADYPVELHILGLGIRTGDEAFAGWIHDIALRRGERNVRILQKFAAHGIDIAADIGGRAMETLSRTHIADALVKRGLARNIGDAFLKYLVKGRLGYESHVRPQPEEALERIASVGGVSAIAHPGKLGEGTEKIIERLKAGGLGGIEVYYPTHTQAKRELLLALCRKYDLFATCGSDFHGLYRSGVRLGMAWEESAALSRTRELLFA